MSADDGLAEQIAAFVRVTGPVGFIKLVKAIPALGGGEQVLCDGSDPNIVLWRGLSEDGVAALQEALAGGKVHLHPTSLVAYISDGGYLRLPLAKRRPKAGYKTPVWAPVVLHHQPYQLAGRRTKPRSKREKSQSTEAAPDGVPAASSTRRRRLRWLG